MVTFSGGMSIQSCTTTSCDLRHHGRLMSKVADVILTHIKCLGAQRGALPPGFCHLKVIKLHHKKRKHDRLWVSSPG